MWIIETKRHLVCEERSETRKVEWVVLTIKRFAAARRVVKSCFAAVQDMSSIGKRLEGEILTMCKLIMSRPRARKGVRDGDSRLVVRSCNKSRLFLNQS